MARKNAHNEIVIITGGCGFIGSNYLNTCVPKYPKTLFVNVDCMTYAASSENIETTVSQSPNYIFTNADIRNGEAVRKIFKTYEPGGVVHFAAESHVDMSIERPALFVETNVLGTANLLEAAVRYKTKRFLQISTDEVYGSLEAKDTAFTESSPLTPNSPYSASKAAAELLARSYRKTFGLDVVITRCSNNYGPRQDISKLIPKFITKLLAGEKVPLYASGSNVRDWIYVTDHVSAIDLVYRKGRPGEVYNIGGNNEMSNLEITRELLRLTGLDESMIKHVKDRPGHDFRYAIDCTKIQREFGWKPEVEFKYGIERTMEFHRNKNGRKMNSDR